MLRSEAALALKLTCSVLLSWPLAAGEISAGRFLNHIKDLSSATYRGRGTGTPEGDAAARYIAAELKKAGLQPAGGTSYLQPFPVSIESKIGDGNSLHYSICSEATPVKYGEDFTPLNFSGSGTLEGEVVFAGYGITAPEYSYDDYAAIDARGKIVLIVRHEPQEFDNNSRFEGRIYTEHAQLFSKALNARRHGAKAVLYVNDSANHSGDDLEKFVSLVGPADPGMPFIQVKASIAEKWFAHSGKDFKALQEEIDRRVEPVSFAFSPDLRIQMRVDVTHRSRDVFNVAGYLPGKTPEYIVIGAHYDHLGLGEQYSLSPEKSGQIHPGADDNGSGTAGLLSLARTLASKPQMRKGVLFVAFAGEEIGLLGSTHYVNQPLLPLKDASLMINMDMIGRIRESKVVVSGATRSSALRSILERLDKNSQLELQLDDPGVYGSSDHTAFQTKSIPVWFFFSGLHADYHKTTDTWEKINSKDAARLLDLIAAAIGEVSDSNMPLQLASPKGTGGIFVHESNLGGR